MSESHVLERPQEEQFDDVPTGVEFERFDGDSETQPTIERPWDPESIRVSTKSFSLRNVLDMIEDGDLELAPDFQRNRVWKASQKSSLIESILLQSRSRRSTSPRTVRACYASSMVCNGCPR